MLHARVKKQLQIIQHPNSPCNMNKALLILLFFSLCCEPKSTNTPIGNFSIHNSNLLDTFSRVLLDEKTFSISDSFKYSIVLYQNTTDALGAHDSSGLSHQYYLKVNGTDSVQIAPFEWEMIDFKGVFDESLLLNRYIDWNDSTVFIAVPSYGATVLYPAVKRNGQYFIKKYDPPQNTLTSFNYFIVDTQRQLVFVPRTRAHGFDNGQIETWKYNGKENKWTMLSTHFFYDPVTKEKIFPNFEDEAIVRRVLKMFQY
jgi:hypothetical protein